MLKLLRKLIGADSGTDGTAERSKPRSATSEVLSKGVRLQGQPASKAAPAQEFDPYNTGAFDRGSSWERIGKR